MPFAARACCLLPSASVVLLAHCCMSLRLSVWPHADSTRLCCCTHVPPSQNVPLLQSLEELTAKYAVDEVHYVGDMTGVLAGLKPVCLHVLEGINSDRCSWHHTGQTKLKWQGKLSAAVLHPS